MGKHRIGRAIGNLKPPAAVFEEAGPDRDLDVVPNVARQEEVGVTMSNSFAFGELNAALPASSA